MLQNGETATYVKEQMVVLRPIYALRSQLARAARLCATYLAKYKPAQPLKPMTF